MNGLPYGVGEVIAFVFGACVGSFVTAAAYRLPRDISLLRPRSYCPSCERALPFWANIPIVSYAALRGRCVMCAAPIGFRHILSEFLLALAALYLYTAFAWPDALARFVLCAALLTCSLIDYDWRVIPNAITFPGIPIGFILAAFLIPEVGWKDSLIGLVLGGGVLFVTGELYFLIRGQEGIGMGDVWLLGMTGAFTGWIGMFFTLFVGSILGSIGGLAYALIAKPAAPAAAPKASEAQQPAAALRAGSAEPAPLAPPEPEQADSILRTEVPFGPFLSAAAAFFTLFQPQLIHWYLSR